MALPCCVNCSIDLTSVGYQGYYRPNVPLIIRTILRFSDKVHSQAATVITAKFRETAMIIPNVIPNNLLFRYNIPNYFFLAMKIFQTSQQTARHCDGGSFMN